MKSRASRWLAGAAFLVALGLVPVLGGAASGSGDPASSTHAVGPRTVRPEGFPLSSSAKSPFGFHPAEVVKEGYPENGYSDAEFIGVRWTRPSVYAFWFIIQPDLGSDTYDFSLPDGIYARVPAGIHILGNLSPQGPIDEGRLIPGTYRPVDEEQYQAFVEAVVERYDGDGIDDMPGLTNPITSWQVSNEPDASVKTGFADLQRLTYEAVKRACPSCTVLIGGATGMPPADEYIDGFDSRYKPILDALGGRFVDVMDIHWYGSASDYSGIRDVLAHVRSTLAADGFPDIPIWITEMGSYSGDPTDFSAGPEFPFQSEAQQAADLFKRYVFPVSLGVEKVFSAFGLVEGFKYDGGYFDFTGLIYDGWGDGDPGLGVKKLAYFTYRKMTQVLEGSDWRSVQIVHDSDDVFACRFLRGGAPVYAAWCDGCGVAGEEPASTALLTLAEVPTGWALVTQVVPDATSGQDVGDDSSAFPEQWLPVVDGTVTLHLGPVPVLVTFSSTGPE